MKKEILYNYLGTNGTILTPIHLEGIYSVKKVRLTAEEGKKLTRDGKTFHITIIVPAEEVAEWYEI